VFAPLILFSKAHPMQRDLREVGERFVAELRCGPRRRISLNEVRAAFARACPELAEQAERRQYLIELIQNAINGGACRLPRDSKARDRQDPSGLPLFIVLTAPDKAPRVVVPQGYPWHPILQFALEERSRRRLRCLKAINEWLKRNPDIATVVPIKERSLEIFGNEKKLDQLRGGGRSLFGARLTLDDLGCRICPLPLPFEMGPPSAQGRPILVLENHNTWFSFCAWNRSTGRYSCVAYGGGGHRNGLAYDQGFLDELLQDAGAHEVTYFGDLDPAGLSIAAGVARIRAERGVAPLIPAVTLYEWLIAHGSRRPMRTRQRSLTNDILWLPEVIRSPVAALFEARLRIPQESLGTIALKNHFSAR
jgi:hypothetical protein